MKALGVGLAVGLGMAPSLAHACSPVDADAMIRQAATGSWALFTVSVAAAGGLVIADIRRRRVSAFAPLGIALLLLHPVWWASPMFGPDCRFPRLDGSALALAASLCLLLAYLSRRRV